ncbi:MAG: tetratricopeptide repeat protein [Opitutales bacterium]
MSIVGASAQSEPLDKQETADEKKARIKTENESLAAENAVLRKELDQLTIALGLNAADIERRYEAALSLFNDRNATKKHRIMAESKMNQAYAAFERLSVQSVSARSRYLRLLFELSYELEHNAQAIEHAIDLALYSKEDINRAFAYNALGRTYARGGQRDQAISYFQKALSVYGKNSEDENALLSEAHCYLSIGSLYFEKRDRTMAEANLLNAQEKYKVAIGPDAPEIREAQSLIDKLKQPRIPPPPLR